METYYTNKPSYEVSTLNVTAAKATELTDAATNSQQVVTTAEEALKDAGDARDVGRATGLGFMGSLIANLNKKLPKDDPRWLAFGLRMPSTQTTPAAPTGLRATVMGMQVLLDCDATPLATLEGIATDLTMEIIVQVVNGGSQSVASDPITVTTTAAAAAKPAPESSSDELAPLAAISPNGNGNGNGSVAVNRINQVPLVAVTIGPRHRKVTRAFVFAK